MFITRDTLVSMKLVQINLTDETHRALKQSALDADRPLRRLIVEVLTAWLHKQALPAQGVEEGEDE